MGFNSPYGVNAGIGNDDTRLIVGTEGTLVVITEMTLKLHGIPETVAQDVPLDHE